MKGGKNFLFTCQRILAAEQKKLKKSTSLLNLPYVKRNLVNQKTTLEKISGRRTLNHVAVLEAIQFFYCLITVKPSLKSPMTFLTQHDLIRKVLNVVQRYRALTFPFSPNTEPIFYSILVETR